MNALQGAFLVLCAALVLLGIASVVRGRGESFGGAVVRVVTALVILSSPALIAALFYGAFLVFLWLGEVKP